MPPLIWGSPSSLRPGFPPMYYGLNSSKGLKGTTIGVIKGMLGVKTIGHMAANGSGFFPGE